MTRARTGNRRPEAPARPRCPSVSSRGKECNREEGHGGLHCAEDAGSHYAWSDGASPESALDLYEDD